MSSSLRFHWYKQIMKVFQGDEGGGGGGWQDELEIAKNAERVWMGF